jgi:hypothetical protein
MAGSKRKVENVDTFMAELEHPLKPELQALRELILAASPEIGEGIKWNAPSFRVQEYFATFNLRSTDSVQLILHLGAKVRALPPGGVVVADPAGLLHWLAKDRALVKFADRAAIATRGSALQALLREWIVWL